MISFHQGPEDRGHSHLNKGLALLAGLFTLNRLPLLAALTTVTVVTTLTGCKEEATWKQNKFKKHELLQSTSDPQMPEILWERIESVYTGVEVKEPPPKKAAASEDVQSASEKSVKGASENGAESADAEVSHAGAEVAGKESAAEPAKPAAKEGAKEGGEAGGAEGGKAAELEKGVLPTEFAPLKVYLVEKNRGVLHGINHEIVFGPGGGEIDLQDFVENRKGSFYFAVEFMPDLPVEKASTGRKIFFLSNSVRRHNKAETIGNGCHNYYDITTSFDAAMKTDGYALNTTDLRHVSALAGTFFFVMKTEGKLSIAQLTIKDSSHRALQCRR